MSKKLKICYLFDDSLDKNDGVQQYIKVLARWQLRNGYDVKFVVGQRLASDNEFEGLLIEGAKNIKVSGNQNTMHIPLYPYIGRIRQFFEKEKFDLVHVQMPYSPLMSQIALNLVDAPRVATFHVYADTISGKVGAWLLGTIQSFSIRSLDKVIAVSTAAQEFAKDYFGVKKSSVVRIPVETQKYVSGKILPKFDDGKFNILFLGRLVERKGVQYLLQAYTQIIKNLPSDSVRLIICGKGELEADLKRYVEQNNLPNVCFEGFIDEDIKQDYYASADLCVFPAIGGESFGIVLIESMATGKVTMGGMNSGYKTVLGEKADELMFNPKDISEFATKMQKLIEDKQLHAKLLEWCKNEGRKYDVEIVGKLIEQEYLQVLSAVSSSD